MSALQSLENSLDDVFGKKAPAMSAGGKKNLVEWFPWISLVAGVLSVWVAYSLYHTAHYVNAAVDFVNNLSAAYGGTKVVNHFGLTVWLAIATLAISGVLYLLAFAPLRAGKKAGWNYLFYGLLFNLVYGVVSVFTDYSGGGRLVSAVIGSAIGFYLLFQIRDSYSKS